MARKKEPPKPLLATKHDFVEALDQVVAQATMLDQLLRTILQQGLLKPGVAALLEERMLAFRRAVFTEE